MPVDIDWRLGVQQNNPLNALSEGFQAGQQMAQQRNALARQSRMDEQAEQDRTRTIQRQNTQDQHQQQQWGREDVLRVAYKVRQTPEAGRAAIYQAEAVPLLQKLGVPDADLQRILADGKLTDQEIDPFIVQMGGDIEQFQTKYHVYQGANGQLDQSAQAYGQAPEISQLRAPQVASEPKWMERTKADGSTELVDVNAMARGGGGQSEPAPAGVTTEALQAFVSQVAPGATMTSGGRSGAHNRAVGGVPNSYHVPDGSGVSHAGDFVPAQGQTVAQLAAVLKAAAPPGVEVIQESDHVHLEPAGQRGARPTSVPWDAPKPDMTPQQARAAGTGLRKEFEQSPDVKQFNTVATQYDIISRLAKARPTAANDISLVFAYMKVLDPTSVVREGEFATAQNAAGIPARVWNAYNKALSGQILNPGQRNEFVEAAGRIYSSNRGRYDELAGQYRGYAADLGLPDNIISTRAPIAGAGGGGGQGDQAPQMTAAQRSAAAQFQGKGRPAGDAMNPYTPRNEAEYNGTPAGAHYIAADGSVRVKGK